MLLFGRLMVTLQPAGPFCVAVPPGHCAELNKPPVLLFTVKVKFVLPHEHTPSMHTLLRQSLATAQSLVRGHFGQTGPPQSMSVSSPFLLPSVQVAAAVVVVELLVLVVVELELLVVLDELVDVLVLVVLELVDVVLDVELLLDVLVLELVDVEVEVVEVVLDVELLLDVLLEVVELVLLELLLEVVVLVVVVVVDASVVDVTVVVAVVLVVGGFGHALPAPLRHTSFAPVPAAIGL
ncbi:MAG TPA: hypothetical protein VNO26_00590 [Candidatus Limnocylindria bacterium]|nr:hypothetical protein [Candidatus Limnocylindria bacterium]